MPPYGGSPQSRTNGADLPHQNSRVVAITGTSSGIGLATAVAAARAGWTTVATLRNPDRADTLRAAASAAGVEIDVRRLDVTDAEACSACLSEVVSEYGRLDAVVNNAGAAFLGTVETADLETFRACLEVNFFGVVHVSRAALPYLRASNGRLLTVSSVGGVVGQPFNEAYCAAKFAVEGFLQALAPVAATVGVSVGVVEPGAVASEFVTNLGLDVDTLLADAGPYTPALQAYLDRTLNQFSNAAQSAEDVADVLVGCLGIEQLPFRTQTSDGARSFVGLSLADVDGSGVLDQTSGWVTG